MAKSKKDSVKHVQEVTEAVVELKGGNKVDVYKKEAKNVYSADYKLIDDTIEEIKKVSRKVCTNDYAANNVYILLQNALKKVTLAEA